MAGTRQLKEAARESGWPLEILEDPARQGKRLDSVAEFMDFLRCGKHSDGEMYILTEGISKLKLQTSLPQALHQACLTKQSTVEALLNALDQGDPWSGELFWWPPGETKREEVCGVDLRNKLLRYRRTVSPTSCSDQAHSLRHATLLKCEGLAFEVYHALQNPTPSCTSEDLASFRLPFWDRGHGFLGSAGAGICLHVDQAWWSNVAKNFFGHKLVALWGAGEKMDFNKKPGHVCRGTQVLDTCGGELFRKPLCNRHLAALGECRRVALLCPGDVACFTGGLPHTTLVVGSALNLTFYESFLNWNCNLLMFAGGTMKMMRDTGLGKVVKSTSKLEQSNNFQDPRHAHGEKLEHGSPSPAAMPAEQLSPYENEEECCDGGKHDEGKKQEIGNEKDELLPHGFVGCEGLECNTCEVLTAGDEWFEVSGGSS
eukprot:s1127_g13.t2